MKAERRFRCHIIGAAYFIFLTATVMGGTAVGGELLQEYPALAGLRTQTAVESSGGVPSVETKQEVIRQAPSISGKFQLRDQTLLPFVGAGFGAGYASERDRALGADLSSQSSGLLGNGPTRGFMPNEFQMGIKIPF
ncbi:MAG TPA: hypothetical protein VFQ34_05725 [Nitrospiraceae bacterium]|jgi:hypothetical protein|nr:hypothetical protein [Nitrospiraceae bacterium]